MLCNTICYGGIFAFTSCSAYILIGLLQVSPDVFGALYAVTVSAYGVGTLVASQIFGEIGVILPMLGYFNIWTVILPFAGFALGTGFVFPSGQAGGISPYPKMAGAASSMLSCLQMSTAAVIGTVTARMLDGSMMPMAWAVFGMGPVLLLSFYMLVVRNPRSITQPAA
ncbi:MAG: hypothetical protein ACKVH1_03125 [Alphaproteobacteria bacterium]